MDLRKRLLKEIPGLKEYTESDQYKYSRDMLKIRYELSFDPNQVADLLDITLVQYVQLESGDIEISSETYKKYLYDLKSYLNRAEHYKFLNAAHEAFNFENENSKDRKIKTQSKYKNTTAGNNIYSNLLEVA